MAAGQQKNVRLSEESVAVLRALKFAMDCSDAEVVSRTLDGEAVRHVRDVLARVRRSALGLVAQAAPWVATARAAAAAVVAALNTDAERFRIEDDYLDTRDGDGTWRKRSAQPDWDWSDPATRAFYHQWLQTARSLGRDEISTAILALACCEQPRAPRYLAIGIPSDLLAQRLRQRLGPPSGALPEEAPLRVTGAAKATLTEGASGLAAIEGHASVGPEHVLVAALQAPEEPLASVARDLGIDPDLVRVLLTVGWSGVQPDLRQRCQEDLRAQAARWAGMKSPS